MMKHGFLAALTVVLGSGVAYADGDAVKGEQDAKVCMACHSLTDQTNRVGPYLLGVYGRKPGTVPNFSYSDAMRNYSTTVAAWDDAALDAFLKNPRSAIPATRMTFAGIEDDAKRADVIAFLKTKK